MQKTTINSASSLQSHIGQLREAYDAHKYLRASYSTGKDRTIDQNAKLHALFTDVAKESEYLGRKLTADQWKNLFISGHAIATGRGVDMVPGLEGEFLNIRESSARMTVARMTSLIEYILAWHAMNEVTA